MQIENIKVSVIMACYNSAAYLEEAVESVISQTHSNWELIAVDDCSTDNTLETLKRYQAADSRIVVISLPGRSGPAIARNAAIQKATGKWIAILDSDDVAFPSRFKEQLVLATTNPGLVIVCSNSISIDSQGNFIKGHNYPTDNKTLSSRLYTMRAFPPHSSMMYQAEMLKKVPGFNTRCVPAEDYDFWVRLSENGRIGSLNRTLVKIRKHSQSISNLDAGVRQFKYAAAVAASHYLRINDWPDPLVSKDEADSQRFLLWVGNELESLGAVEKYNLRNAARAEYFSSGNALLGILRFVARLLISGYAVSLVKDKFIGSSLPRMLASRWMGRRHKSV